jgi:hypothetical protein
MAYTDEFGNIFGTAEEFQTIPNAQEIFYNTEDTPWTGGDVFNYDWGSALSSTPAWLDRLKNFGTKAGNFATSDKGIMAILAAIAAASDRQRKSGGGAGERFAGPTPVTRTMTQGKYGPTAMYKYAANGGLMQAYAQGGQVQMEDGGFVMTKKAVDGAGGPRGLASLIPGARMIGGPPDPTGRKDLTPAVIHGPNGQTPAKVSRGEAYVPPGRDPKKLYALMHELERKA